ncbi:hypothetical protein [Marilutibacter spongiae]|nr:hypothetical protein [Lysobacter spongiae]
MASTLPSYDSQEMAPPRVSAQDREASTAYALRREEATTLALTTDELDAARTAMAAVMAEPLFETLGPGEKRYLASSAAWVEVRAGRYEAAAGFYRDAVRMDPGDPDDWHRLSMVEDILGHHDASIDALLRILESWPELYNGMSAGHVLALVRHLPRESDKRLELMLTLFESNWKPGEEAASTLWYELALTLVEREERERAQHVVDNVFWPDPLIRMQADRRFDGLLATDPTLVGDRLDVLVEGLASMAADNPRNLYTEHERMDAMLAAGRSTEVVAIAEDIVARIDGEDPRRPVYHDGDDLNATLAILSTALRREGRLDEAEAALRRASGLPEAGEPNITQRLSLASWYNARMRPAEAIAMADGLGVMAEAPDKAWRDAVLLHAAIIEGRSDDAMRLLDRLRAVADGNEALLMRALLRIGDVDEAAALYVRRLQDPRLRGDALLLAQRSLEPTPLPGELETEQRMDAMLARPDVLAAIDAVGRVQDYPVW